MINVKKNRTVFKNGYNSKKRKNNNNNNLIENHQQKIDSINNNNNNKTLFIGFSNCAKFYLRNYFLL